MDFETILRFALALAFVLGLLLLLAAAARRWNWASRAMPARGKRLGVIEITAIDGKRSLALVRRDGTEHLLLLGPHGDLVVERSAPALASGPVATP